ncbi:hypothetical protein CDAR_297481 [Caerostris darwini]|uniref:Uncharacterized protein n=1 Tax=Caerostris darwini TaxID=1538125 RepID=A0AAV4PQ16_9ARAC|nr:hypothetical protein CDAR_297481 [Caerostris darwini]
MYGSNEKLFTNAELILFDVTYLLSHYVLPTLHATGENQSTIQRDSSPNPSSTFSMVGTSGNVIIGNTWYCVLFILECDLKKLHLEVNL